MLELGITRQEAKAILNPLYAAHVGEKITFVQRLKASFSLAVDKERKKDMAEKKKRQELEQSGVAYCPKRLSTSVQGAKRGYSAGWGWMILGLVLLVQTRCSACA